MDHQITPGVRVHLRGEDFLVTHREANIIHTEGISELVHSKQFQFNLDLEDDLNLIEPEHTELKADTSYGYRKTKLFIETTLRNASHFSNKIEIADKAAIYGANYQLLPTIKSLKLPQPRILIADAVGLGKTVQVGIFMAELIRRGKGRKILVVTPKSILAQFQQEIWARFAIPLVRLDSKGIARIKSIIPSNKNPFDYYDKVIVSIDTLKNDAKFRHDLEKIQWDIVAIDECHIVANANSQRGSFAAFLAERTEALILTSATPHNGKKENFANLIRLLDPIAVPEDEELHKEDIEPLFVRRFKKDIEDEVGDAFRDRKSDTIDCHLNVVEEQILSDINTFKRDIFEATGGNLSNQLLFFSVGLFKAYMSSPAACLATINRRLKREKDEEEVKELLKKLRSQLQTLLDLKQDSKLNQLFEFFKENGWKGQSNDNRYIIFSERRDTLNYLEGELRKTFKLKDKAVVQFNGSLTDTEQQEILEDFSKEDSDIRLFLSSDAGSQGVNLHYHCHQMINYDIPWSIITLDQRNGRIDRFGQTETPCIYYFVSRSRDPVVHADIRIIERLMEKEEEVYKTLGDPAKVFKLFESDREENFTRKAVAASSTEAMDVVLDTSSDDDWLDAFSIDDPEELYQREGNNLIADAGFTFYQHDFAFYESLAEELIQIDQELKDVIQIHPQDKYLELVKSKELSREAVLFDLPEEAFPPKNHTFKLTTKKEVVEKAIKNARKKQNTWPTFQLLYDLHPIAKWLQNKFLAKIDRGNALVARLGSPLLQNTIWYVFHVTASNAQGRPIYAQSLVIGKDLKGESVGNFESFDDFANANRLKDTLPNWEMPKEDMIVIQNQLVKAVNSAAKLYDLKVRGDLEDELEEKLENYESRLQEWMKGAQLTLDLKYGEDSSGVVGHHKSKRQKEIQLLNDKLDEFYKAYFQLEQKPYMRLLAVFYNKAQD